jgi:hypothetical protein
MWMDQIALDQMRGRSWRVGPTWQGLLQPPVALAFFYNRRCPPGELRTEIARRGTAACPAARAIGELDHAAGIGRARSHRPDLHARLLARWRLGLAVRCRFCVLAYMQNRCKASFPPTSAGGAMASPCLLWSARPPGIVLFCRQEKWPREHGLLIVWIRRRQFAPFTWESIGCSYRYDKIWGASFFKEFTVCVLMFEEMSN